MGRQGRCKLRRGGQAARRRCSSGSSAPPPPLCAAPSALPPRTLEQPLDHLDPASEGGQGYAVAGKHSTALLLHNYGHLSSPLLAVLPHQNPVLSQYQGQ